MRLDTATELIRLVRNFRKLLRHEVEIQQFDSSLDRAIKTLETSLENKNLIPILNRVGAELDKIHYNTVSYTHLRAHET